VIIMNRSILSLIGLLVAVVALTEAGNDGNCPAMLNCVSSFRAAFVSANNTADNINANGLANVCQDFQQYKSCFESALHTCPSNDAYRPRAALVIGVIRFICEREIALFTANEQCLFSPTSPMRSVRRQCLTQQLRNVCSLSADSECAVNLAVSTCQSPELGQKFRQFFAAVQQRAGCQA